MFAYPSILLYWLREGLVGVKSARSGIGWMVVGGSVSLYGDINLEA